MISLQGTGISCLESCHPRILSPWHFLILFFLLLLTAVMDHVGKLPYIDSRSWAAKARAPLQDSFTVLNDDTRVFFQCCPEIKKLKLNIKNYVFLYSRV